MRSKFADDPMDAATLDRVKVLGPDAERVVRAYLRLVMLYLSNPAVREAARAHRQVGACWRLTFRPSGTRKKKADPLEPAHKNSGT